MQKKYFTILTSCLILLSGSTYAAAPDAEFKGLDDKTHHLSEYIGKGKWTVLNIWGTRCPPCLEEMPELQSFHDAHHEKDATVLGIALDFPSFGYAKREEVKAFMEDHLISFPTLLSDGLVGNKLGIGMLEGTPTTLVYNRAGELLAKQVGPVDQQLLEDFIQKQEKSLAFSDPK